MHEMVIRTFNRVRHSNVDFYANAAGAANADISLEIPAKHIFITPLVPKKNGVYISLSDHGQKMRDLQVRYPPFCRDRSA